MDPALDSAALGVSLVTADEWILHYFASGAVGDITRLNYAKCLFAVPTAVLGRATSQASFPVFAKLFGEKRLREFAGTVNGSIYRIVRHVAARNQFHHGGGAAADRFGYRRGHFPVLVLTLFLRRTRSLLSRLLCRR